MRARLLFKPSEQFNAVLTWQYQRTITSTGPYQNSATIPEYDPEGRLVGTVNASPTESRLAIPLNSAGQDTGGYVPLGGGLGCLERLLYRKWSTAGGLQFSLDTGR